MDRQTQMQVKQTNGQITDYIYMYIYMIYHKLIGGKQMADNRWIIIDGYY